MRKTNIAVAAAFLMMSAPFAWAAEESDEEKAPGGERHIEQRLQIAKALEVSGAVPPETSCELSTPDFVVTGSESTVSGDEHCFPSDGGGGFAPRSDIKELQIVDGMDVADMDNDGDNDFLVCDGLASEVYLYSQGPAGVFTPSLVASGITSGSGGSLFCTNLRESDFNGDGLKDFVVGDNRVTQGMFVYLQGPVNTFTPVASGLDISWATATGGPCNCIFGVAAGDVDGDMRDDVLVLGYRGLGTGQVWFYQGNGAGGMAAPVLKFNVSVDFPVVANPTGLALFDLEEDGDLDIVVGGSFDGSHYVYTNDGLGNFSAPAGAAFTTDNFSGIDAFDVEGDDKEDLMLVDWSNRRLLFTQNIGGGLAAPVAVGTVDGPSIGIGAPPRPAKRGFELDHFKCYLSQDRRPVDTEVVLSDQFGAGEAKVFESERFCNPVTKIHDDVITPIRDKDAHLEFLRIEARGETPSLVAVNNQFGEEQKLEIGDAVYLAVPTQKIKPNDHSFPRGLDHFKCYKAQGEAQPVKVGLRDQFGFEPELRAFEPRLLCNPTKKLHDGVVTPIGNPLDHLVCYELFETKQLNDFTLIRNQFGTKSLNLEHADLLCLPSEKRVLQ